jgi:hypothetical protein
MTFEKDSLSVEAIEEMMDLEAIVPSEIILDSLDQSDFPSFAKNPELMRKIEHARSGHFSSSGRYNYLKDLAFEYAFILDTCSHSGVSG